MERSTVVLLGIILIYPGSIVVCRVSQVCVCVCVCAYISCSIRYSNHNTSNNVVICCMSLVPASHLSFVVHTYAQVAIVPFYQHTVVRGMHVSSCSWI
jgi:hypothetical protein